MSDDIIKSTIENSGNVIEKVYDDLIAPTVQPLGEILGYFPRQVRVWFQSSHTQILLAEKNMTLVARKIQKEAEKIPEEKLTEPEAYVAIPALEQLTYCCDCEELRDLYTNLLLSSMNSDTKSKVHPSFTSIIRDLSPDEAKLLNYLHKNVKFPLIDLRLNLNSGGHVTVFSNFSNIGDTTCEHPKNISSYLENLNRLQIIDIDSMHYLSNEDVYDKLEKHSIITSIKALSTQEGTWSINKKKAQITNFGRQFIEACVAP